MTPLPDAARYFVALSDHAHKAYAESDLRRLYGERTIKRDTLIAPVNTTDWKQLTSVFPDWTPLRPAGVISPPAVPLPEVPKPAPPFRPQLHALRVWGNILAILAIAVLFIGLSSCQKHGNTYFWTEGNVIMMKIAFVTGLLAIGLGIAGEAAAKQDAMLAALNWMITQDDKEAAKPSEVAPPEEK